MPISTSLSVKTVSFGKSAIIPPSDLLPKPLESPLPSLMSTISVVSRFLPQAKVAMSRCCTGHCVRILLVMPTSAHRWCWCAQALSER